jgi:hypothetical protein
VGIIFGFELNFGGFPDAQGMKKLVRAPHSSIPMG